MARSYVLTTNGVCVWSRILQSYSSLTSDKSICSLGVTATNSRGAFTEAKKCVAQKWVPADPAAHWGVILNM